jgi:DNA-binding transcriptional MerR regulator
MEEILAADAMSVSTLAERVGVHPQTIRRWEARGLTPLRQQVGGRLYRVYLPSSVEVGKRLLAERRRKPTAS